jgi:MFS family permease
MRRFRTRPAGAEPVRGGAGLTLAAACLALFAIFLDNTVVNVALPSIQRSLGATPDQLEGTVSAYVVAFASLILLGGKLGDRFGRRRVFMVGLALFGAASVLGAIAPSSGVLIAARAAQGVGAALLAPLSLSLLVAAFPRDKLPAAIGIWAGVSGLGLAVGPLVGGALVEASGWQAVFWINAPIVLLALLLAAVGVRESGDPALRSLDLAGAALATGGLASLVAGLIRTATHGWTSLPTVVLLAVGGTTLVAFVLYERRIAEPLVPVGLLADRRFRAATAAVALSSFALLGVICSSRSTCRTCAASPPSRRGFGPCR